jgi:hypothetical protein
VLIITSVIGDSGSGNSAAVIINTVITDTVTITTYLALITQTDCLAVTSTVTKQPTTGLALTTQTNSLAVTSTATDSLPLV